MSKLFIALQTVTGLLTCLTIIYAHADILSQCRQENLPTVSWNNSALTNCNTMSTDFSAQDITWTGFIPTQYTRPDKITVEGSNTKTQFKPEIARGEHRHSTSETGILPFSVNILTKLNATVFGLEERASLQRSKGIIQLTCSAGEKPAGLILTAGQYRFAQGLTQAINITGQAQGQFGFSLVTKGKDATNNIKIFPENKTSQLSLALNTIQRADKQITVLCPDTAATLTIQTLDIQPVINSSSGRTKLNTSSWVWDIKLWQKDPDILLKWAQVNHIKQLYIAIAIQDNQVSYADQLKKLIRNAQQLGIQITVVEGDARMVRPDGLTHALGRARVLADFQQQLPADARLTSLQYDIEPYILPEYGLDPASQLKAWVKAISQLYGVWGNKLEIVVPYWLPGTEAGKNALNSIRPYTSTLNVMAYRTTDEFIIEAAEPLLNWGVQNGIDIVIALENGPIPDSIHRIYLPSSEGGELIYIPAKEGDIVLLANRVLSSKTGETYKFSYEVPVPGRNISFLNDISALQATRDRLQPIFSAWPSFQGMALHELYPRNLK